MGPTSCQVDEWIFQVLVKIKKWKIVFEMLFPMFFLLAIKDLCFK